MPTPTLADRAKHASSAAGNRATGLLGWARWSFAALLSGIALPAATIMVAVYPLVLGSLSARSGLPLVGAITVIALMSWHVGRDERTHLPWLMLGAALIAWMAGTLMVARRYFGGPVSAPVIVCLWAMSTLWIFCLGWLQFFPSPTNRRWRILAFCLAMAPIFPAVFHVGEIRGDGHLPVEWRWRHSRPSRAISKVGGQVPAPILDKVLPHEFPGFLGPKRSAIVHGCRLAKDWRRHPPVTIWRQPVGAAWSGFAVARGLAVTQEQTDGTEAVVAFDARTGEKRWTHSDPTSFDGNGAGGGPRATPTIDGGRVFTVGATGILNCLDLESGRRVWSRHILADVGSTPPEHGVTGSPLCVGDLVIVAPSTSAGPSLAAYAQADGTPRWKAGSRAASYSSPTLCMVFGASQVSLLDSGGLTLHDPQSGRTLGTLDWGNNFGNRCCQPVFSDSQEDYVILSSYECGGTYRLSISKAHTGNNLGTHVDWKSSVLKTKFTTPILWQGCLIGIDQGILVCLDSETGKRLWKGGRYGEGQLLLVDDLLLVLAESGELVLIEPSRLRLNELGRITVLHGKTWNAPAIAQGLLYVRNGEEAACYALPIDSIVDTETRHLSVKPRPPNE